MVDTVDSIALDSISSININRPIAIRKNFPETWIWNNINESGFVTTFYAFVWFLCCNKVVPSYCALRKFPSI